MALLDAAAPLLLLLLIIIIVVIIIVIIVIITVLFRAAAPCCFTALGVMLAAGHAAMGAYKTTVVLYVAIYKPVEP